MKLRRLHCLSALARSGWLPLLFVLAALEVAHAADRTPEVDALLKKAGIPSTAAMRGQMDTVGFVHTADQTDKVWASCQAAARPRAEALTRRQGWTEREAFVAAICPHDDHAYAGRLYALVLPRLKARHILLLGVFHKARAFGCRDRLVFDRFSAWRGPYGPVSVSPLREELTRRLPAGDWLADDDMHAAEHSLEAMVPFLQAQRRDVEICPVLVPYMSWETLVRLGDDLAGALVETLRARGWVLGRDVAVLVSTDGVHYGDTGWGAKPYCPFDCGPDGYRLAVEQDLRLAGLLAGPLIPGRAKPFFEQCVDPADVTRYRVTWCGRFSVPLGVEMLARLYARMKLPPPSGVLLDYGTSVSEATLDVTGLDGLGLTAPANFHHFVGYPAIGYPAGLE